MSDEAALLAYIRAHPDERAARLVYADWLDEHEHALGEYVRAECELTAHAFGTPDWHLALTQLYNVCERGGRTFGGWEYADRAAQFLRNERGIRFNAPAVETELLQFERRHGITLPAEYRAFLLRVGNGVTLSANRGLHHFEHRETFGQLARPFPYTPVDAVRVLAALKKVVPFDFEGCDIDYSADGNLLVAPATVLVVRGELRGQLWVYGEYSGFTPWSDGDFARPTGFFHYLQTILDDA